MKTLALVVTVVLAAAPLPTSVASPPLGAVVNGRIAFTTTAPGSDVTNLASISADGSDERSLTPSTTIASEAVEWIPAATG